MFSSFFNFVNMIFSFFNFVKKKETLDAIGHMCITQYNKNKTIDIEKVREEVAKAPFKIAPRHRKKIIMNFLKKSLNNGEIPIILKKCLNSSKIPSILQESLNNGKIPTTLDNLNRLIGALDNLVKALEMQDELEIRRILNNFKNKRNYAEREKKIIEMEAPAAINTTNIILRKQEEAYFNTEVEFYQESKWRQYKDKGLASALEEFLYQESKRRQHQDERLPALPLPRSNMEVVKGTTIHDYIEPIDRGDFIITNQRIIFIGSSKNWTIALTGLIKIQEITLSGYPILYFVTTAATKKKIIRFSDDTERLEAETILDRILSNNNIEKVVEMLYVFDENGNMVEKYKYTAEKIRKATAKL